MKESTSQDILAETLVSVYSTLSALFATYKQGKYTAKKLHMFFIAGFMEGALPDDKEDDIIDARIGDKIRKIMKAYAKGDLDPFISSCLEDSVNAENLLALFERKTSTNLHGMQNGLNRDFQNFDDTQKAIVIRTLRKKIIDNKVDNLLKSTQQKEKIITLLKNVENCNTIEGIDTTNPIVKNYLIKTLRRRIVKALTDDGKNVNVAQFMNDLLERPQIQAFDTLSENSKDSIRRGVFEVLVDKKSIIDIFKSTTSNSDHSSENIQKAIKEDEKKTLYYQSPNERIKKEFSKYGGENHLKPALETIDEYISWFALKLFEFGKYLGKSVSEIKKSLSELYPENEYLRILIHVVTAIGFFIAYIGLFLSAIIKDLTLSVVDMGMFIIAGIYDGAKGHDHVAQNNSLLEGAEKIWNGIEREKEFKNIFEKIQKVYEYALKKRLDEMYVDGYEKIKNSPSKADAVVMNVFRKRIHRYLHYAMEEMRVVEFLSKNQHLITYINNLTDAAKKMNISKVEKMKNLVITIKYGMNKNVLRDYIENINAVLKSNDGDFDKIESIKSIISSAKRVNTYESDENLKTFIGVLEEIVKSKEGDQAVEILKNAKENGHYNELMQYFEESRLTTAMQHVAAAFDTFTVIIESALYDASYYASSWVKLNTEKEKTILP